MIDRDDRWSGAIWLTDDVTIEEGTITVEPGTVIEFIPRGDKPTIVLKCAARGQEIAGLELQGTTDKPIVVRSRGGKAVGRIEIIQPERAPAAQPAASKPTAEFTPPPAPNRIEWRHVRFEHLGPRVAEAAESIRPTNDPTRTAPGGVAPGILIHAEDADAAVRLEECSFTHCGRLQIDAGQNITISLTANRFQDGSEPAALSVQGVSRKGKLAALDIDGNRANGLIRVDGLAVRVSGSTLHGELAGIIIGQSVPPGAIIEDNYIHNTTPRDDGTYCIDCRSPETRIHRNVIRGGSTCVLNGSADMRGNVIIASPRLDHPTQRDARTRVLVGSLPTGAIFENNILIGSAHSLIAPQQAIAAWASSGDDPRRTPETIIRNNVFDGMGGAARAIILNHPTRRFGRLSVYNNLFLRLDTLLVDEARKKDSLFFADYNAVAPRPRVGLRGRVVSQGDRVVGEQTSHDVIFDDPASLTLSGILPRRLPRGDALDGPDDRSPESLREAWFSIYRPAEGSPLLGSGRPSVDSTGRSIRSSVGIEDSSR